MAYVATGPVMAQPPFPTPRPGRKEDSQRRGIRRTDLPGVAKGAAPPLMSLSKRHYRLPKGPTFRREGKDLLPEPDLPTYALLIDHCPERPQGKPILACGDVESNPGPGTGPAGSAQLRTYLLQHQMTDMFTLEERLMVNTGPSSSSVAVGCSVLQVRCEICNTRFQCRDSDVMSLARHAERCLDEICGLQQGSGARAVSLLTCGDVEANPGPTQGPSAGRQGKRILRELRQAGLQDNFDLFFMETPEAGPCGRTGGQQREAGRNGWWEARCRCGVLIKTRTWHALRAHAAVCFLLGRGGAEQESKGNDGVGYG